MSRRVEAFRQHIANPLNIVNFELVVPGLDDYAITVQSTSYPSESARVVTLYTRGEDVQYPTVPNNSHTWSISIPESDTGEARRRMEALRAKYWNQTTGTINVGLNNPFDIYIVRARDLNDNIVFSIQLVNAWVQGRGDVALSRQNPETNWAWEYQIRFDYIIEEDNQ